MLINKIMSESTVNFRRKTICLNDESLRQLAELRLRDPKAESAIIRKAIALLHSQLEPAKA